MSNNRVEISAASPERFQRVGQDDVMTDLNGQLTIRTSGDSDELFPVAGVVPQRRRATWPGQLARPQIREGQMGDVYDVLTVAVGAGGLGPALAMSRSWIAQVGPIPSATDRNESSQPWQRRSARPVSPRAGHRRRPYRSTSGPDPLCRECGTTDRNAAPVTDWPPIRAGESEASIERQRDAMPGRGVRPIDQLRPDVSDFRGRCGPRSVRRL